MNYYLLSVTNDFASEGMCKEIALSISPIVDSPNLKFHYTRNQIIFSFGTETPKDEIYEYITGILYGLVDIFILTEVVDDFSVSLPKDIKDHLFDLENVGENVTMKLDMERIKKNLDFSFDDDDDDDDDEDIISLIFKNKITEPNPTLDQILEKLYSEGINSLSSKEKNILQTYSQN
jgi:regulator of replication initiation timing